MTEVSSTRLYLGNLPRNGMPSHQPRPLTGLPLCFGHCPICLPDSPTSWMSSGLQFLAYPGHAAQGFARLLCASTQRLRGLVLA